MKKYSPQLLVGGALLCGALAYWGIDSSRGATFFQGWESVPLFLGYLAAGLLAIVIVVSELGKERF